MRVGVLASHPIQYNSPVFRELAGLVDLEVFYAHRQSAAQQAQAGFGVAFDWDRDLLSGYAYRFLDNVASAPGVERFGGCDTPGVAAAIERGAFDVFVVGGWNLKCYWQAVMACRDRGVPVLARGDSRLDARSGVRVATRQLTHRFLLGYFDGFLVPGSRNREYLLRYGAASDRLFDAPHSVDVPWFVDHSGEARPDREERRAGIGAAASDLILMFVGRLLGWKRALDVVHAAARLQHSGVATMAVFVGDGPERRAIETRADELGVRAHFAGFRNQSELPPWYVIGDLLVLPSTSQETWGLVVNEAFACGLPAVVADTVGCAPDMIENGVTGGTYPVGDVDGLTDSIRRFLPRLGSESVRAALERVSAQHTPVATAVGFRKAGETVVVSGRRGGTQRRMRRPSPIPLLERLPW